MSDEQVSIDEQVNTDAAESKPKRRRRKAVKQERKNAHDLVVEQQESNGLPAERASLVPKNLNAPADRQLRDPLPDTTVEKNKVSIELSAAKVFEDARPFDDAAVRLAKELKRQWAERPDCQTVVITVVAE